MKEKRYFIDVINSNTITNNPKRATIIFVIFLFIIGFITFFISLKMGFSKNSYSLNSYSTDTYNYMEEIAKKVIVEGSGIDLKSIPDDISTYNINYNDNIIKFEYSLIGNANDSYTPIPQMKITLSKDFKILEKNLTSYSSENSYIKSIKFNMIIFSILNALCMMLFCCILFIIYIFIRIVLSYFHKKIDQKILARKE